MDNSAVIAAALATGNIASLDAAQRGEYYKRVCESLQLNYLTSPLYFQTSEDGRESLAVNKSGAAALRKIHGISINRTERQITRDLAIFTVYGMDKEKREDSATGVSTLDDLTGQRLADAIMGAETKAKNRLTISLSGLGFLDSSELSRPSAQQVDPSPLQPPASAAAIAASVNQAPATETTDTRPQDLPVSHVPTVEIPELEPVVLTAPEPAQKAPEQPVLAPEPAPVAQQPQPQPETPAVATVAPAQPPTAGTPAVSAIQVAPAPTVTAEDIPATPAEYATFVTNRASKLLRDVLQKGSIKNANSLLQDWFVRESGKASLKKISAATWERMLSMIENRPAEEVVVILRGGKK